VVNYLTSYEQVDDAFFDAVEAAIVAKKSLTALSGSTLEVHFYNPQKQFKRIPVYPEIIIQPLIPQENETMRDDRSHTTDPIPTGDEELSTYKWFFEQGVVHMIFDYQVSCFTDRWDHARAIHTLIAQHLFPRTHGMRSLLVGEYTRTLIIKERTSTPVLRDGIFQDVFIFSVEIPIYEGAPELILTPTGITLEIDVP